MLRLACSLHRVCLHFLSLVVCLCVCMCLLRPSLCRPAACSLGLACAQRACKWLQALINKAPTQPTDLQDCFTARGALSASLQGVCTNAASREVDERGAVAWCFLLRLQLFGLHGGAGQQKGCC